MMRTLFVMLGLVGLLLAFEPVPNVASSHVQTGSAQSTCSAPNIQYSTFIGGALTENANDIVVDEAGTAFISGTTFSSQFPADAPRRSARHGVDMAGLALAATGATLPATYWVDPPAGNLEDYGYAVALDSVGNRYFAGDTASDEFCSTLGASLPGVDSSYNGNTDGFLFRVSGATGAVDYCTYIGGSEPETVQDIAIASDDTVYVLGDTFSQNDFPDATGLTHAGARDVFVLQIAAGATSFSNVTLLGGTGNDLGRGMTLDGNDNAHVVGWTFSADFPTTPNAFDSTKDSGSDAFFAQISSSGTLQTASYLGGSGDDRAYAIALDASGRRVIAGGTTAANFPTSANAYDASHNGGAQFSGFDGFLAVLSSSGAVLDYGSFYGGSGEEAAVGLFLDGTMAYMTGQTDSADFPITSNALDSTLAADEFGDAFLLQYDLSSNSLAYSTFWGGSESDEGAAVFVDNGEIYLTGESSSAELCTTAGAYDETHNGDSDMFVLKFTPEVAPTVVALAQNSAGATASPTLVLIGLAVLSLMGLTKVSKRHLSLPAASRAQRL